MNISNAHVRVTAYARARSKLIKLNRGSLKNFEWGVGEYAIYYFKIWKTCAAN